MTQANKGISDRAVKLAALAMDDAAGQGERRNAAEMFFREIAKAGMKPRDLQTGERIVYQEKVVYKEKEKQATVEHRMPFGKYRGQRVIDILQFDRGYLEWAYCNANTLSDHEGLKDYLRELLGW